MAAVGVPVGEHEAEGVDVAVGEVVGVVLGVMVFVMEGIARDVSKSERWLLKGRELRKPMQTDHTCTGKEIIS